MSQKKVTRILVTGASGFVGGAFMQRFSARNDLALWGVARRPMQWQNYTQVDLSEGLDIAFTPDVVVHAAAHVSPWGSAKTYREKNVLATQSVVDFCRRRGLPRLVYLSSSSVFYRDEPQLNLTEDSPIGPDFINDYSASKYAGEVCVGTYEGESVILRPRAIFGPGDTVLFPRILQAAKRGRLPLIQSGTTPAIGDLIYIDTLSDYILKAALKPNLLPAYNLTNAETVEFQSLLIQVLKALDLPVPTRTVSAKTLMLVAGVIEFIYKCLGVEQEPPLTRYGVSVLAHSKTFNVKRMLADLGPPTVSIEAGIAQFIQWQRTHG